MARSAVPKFSSDDNNMSSSSVQVVVRLRPMNEKEKKHGTLPVVSASTQDKTVTIIKGQGSKQVKSKFCFDNVFTAFSNQQEVFEATLKPVISDVMSGYESTVFAYGQTGTGKTHTMEGDLSNPEMHGVIPRSAQAIFERLKKPDYNSYTVTCSYLEIYNEELCDLLCSDQKHSHSFSEVNNRKGTKLEIMEGKNGTFCRGLTEIEVKSAKDVLDLMQTAQQQRRIGETKMNEHSSRSHCIFTIRIQAKKILMDGNILDFSGKLHMVDLAGSECAKTASLDKINGAEVARERERMNINRSLLTLGRVISLLKQQNGSKKSSNIRIPYRDSKLTRILQESLGGRCKTLIFATLSPSITAIEESISTLNYAQSASGIVNKPVATSFLSIVPSGKGHVASMPSSENGTNEANSVEHWHEMECRLQYMQAQVDEAQAALARQHMQQQELTERAAKAEASCLEIEKKHFEAVQKINLQNVQIEEKKEENKSLSNKLTVSENHLKRTAAILEATQKTESALTLEAKSLIQTLKDSINDGDNLHNIILNTREMETKRQRATKDFHSLNLNILLKVTDNLQTVSEQLKKHQTSMKETSAQFSHNSNQIIDKSVELFDRMFSNILKWCSVVDSNLKEKDGILDTIKKTSVEIENSLHGTKEAFLESEISLKSSSENLDVSLDKHSSHLRKLGAEYQEMANKSLISLETKIVESKKKIGNIVNASTKAIDNISVSRSQERENLNNLITHWLCSSNEIGKNAKYECSSSKKLLNEAAENFSVGMKCHDVMMDSLDEQKSFLDESKRSQSVDLNEQISILNSQRNEFEAAQKRQKQKNEEFMKEAMKSVQDLLMKQFSSLIKDQEDQSILIQTSNSRILQKNSKICSSINSVLKSVEGSGNEMKKRLENVHSSELKMLSAAKTTSNTIAEIEKLIDHQSENIKKCSDKAIEGMGKLSELDSKTEESFKNIQTKGSDCADYIDSTILPHSRESFSGLSRASEKITSYSLDKTISSTKSSLLDIMKPRTFVQSEVSTKLDSIQEYMESGSSTIQRIISEHCLASENFEKDMKSNEIFNKEVVNELKTETAKFQNTFMERVSKHVGDNTFKVNQSVSGALNVKKSIDNFSNNVIKVQDKIQAVPERKIFVYSEKMSATPHKDEIFKNLEIISSDKKNCEGKENRLEKTNHVSPRNEEGRISDLSDGSLSVRSDSSTIPIPPSPALRERSMNVDSFTDRSSKSLTSTNKKSSTKLKVRPRTTGTPTGSRKKSRVTSTPTRSFVKSKRNFK